MLSSCVIESVLHVATILEQGQGNFKGAGD
jgi:hypothetical protein